MTRRDKCNISREPSCRYFIFSSTIASAKVCPTSELALHGIHRKLRKDFIRSRKETPFHARVHKISVSVLYPQLLEPYTVFVDITKAREQRVGE